MQIRLVWILGFKRIHTIMMGRQAFSEQRIIDCLVSDYGIEVAKFTFLPLGADMNASVYKAISPDNTTYFVKLKRGHHHEINIEVAKLLHASGIQQIIPPIKTRKGQSTQPIDDFTLIVYPYVEGQDGFTRSLTDYQWIALGKAMRQVHEIEVPALIQKELRREAYSAKWREIVRSLYLHIETEIMQDEIAAQLTTFMKKNSVAIHRLVDRSEQLAQLLQQESPQFVLCHSDIHGGNVLMNGNTTLYIVDWDEPMMAPKERDLMYIGAGVANVWNDPREVTLFYEGYGKTEVNMAMLSYYRHERIVEDIALFGQDLLLMSAGGANRSEIFKFFIAMFEPNGVVEIAFKS